VLGGLPLVIVASSGALSSTLPTALVVAAVAPPVLGALLLRSER
jgi:hypothetical protein